MKTKRTGCRNDVIFVYDGDCPICGYAAHATRIQKEIGDLHLIDARSNRDHPIHIEIRERGLNLDDGMVLKYKDKFYHGQQALMLMARLGTNENWFNRMNRLLFHGETLSRIGYPPMRAIRNLLLKINGVPKLKNLEDIAPGTSPFFQKIFAGKWPELPKIFHTHYAPRPGTSDRVTVEGKLDIKISPLVSIMSRITGALIPYSGEAIPVTVTFRCGQDGKSFHFDRAFHYPDHGTYNFRSKMVHIGNNELIEFIRLHRMAPCLIDDKVILKHLGYNIGRAFWP